MPETERPVEDARPREEMRAVRLVAVVVAKVEVPVTVSVDEKFPVVPVIAPRLAMVEYSVVAVKAEEEALESVVCPVTESAVAVVVARVLVPVTASVPPTVVFPPVMVLVE